MIETFMFCDVRRYEVSVRGDMRGTAVLPLVSSIDRVPDECTVLLDLIEVTDVDPEAVTLLRGAIDGRLACGVDLTIEVGAARHAAVLAAGGLGALLDPGTLRKAS